MEILNLRSLYGMQEETVPLDQEQMKGLIGKFETSPEHERMLAANDIAVACLDAIGRPEGIVTVNGSNRQVTDLKIAFSMRNIRVEVAQESWI